MGWGKYSAASVLVVTCDSDFEYGFHDMGVLMLLLASSCESSNYFSQISEELMKLRKVAC